MGTGVVDEVDFGVVLPQRVPNDEFRGIVGGLNEGEGLKHVAKQAAGFDDGFAPLIDDFGLGLNQPELGGRSLLVGDNAAQFAIVVGVQHSGREQPEVRVVDFSEGEEAVEQEGRLGLFRGQQDGELLAQLGEVVDFHDGVAG